MGGLRVVRVGLGAAAIAVGLVTAGCLAPSKPAPPAPASLSMSPATANFPTLPPPYSPMPIIPVTVTNTGGHTANSVTVTGVGVYSVPTNGCMSATLAPGQSCVADIQFCPGAPGPYMATLTVTGRDAVTGSMLDATSALDGNAT